MTKIASFNFDELQAKIVSDRLERSMSQMDEAIDFVESNCSQETIKSFTLAIGKVIAELTMDILDEGIYQRYPHLKPTHPLRELQIPNLQRHPSVASQPNLADVSLLELLIEALYLGESKCIPSLAAYEPLSIAAIDGELKRRSDISNPATVDQWCNLYLASDKLSTDDRQVLLAMMEHKKLIDAAFRPRREEGE